MALRNPNLFIFGTGYPLNVYEIRNRFIEPINSIVNVAVSLRCYTDESKQYSPKEYQFTLKDLPNDPALLNPSLYQQELLAQHGGVVIDGTKLSDYTVLS